MPARGPVQVILTRLHVRYSAATFPEDLTFQQTQDQENFQARYVIRHPWTGSPDACTAAPVISRNSGAGTKPTPPRSPI